MSAVPVRLDQISNHSSSTCQTVKTGSAGEPANTLEPGCSTCCAMQGSPPVQDRRPECITDCLPLRISLAAYGFLPKSACLRLPTRLSLLASLYLIAFTSPSEILFLHPAKLFLTSCLLRPAKVPNTQPLLNTDQSLPASYILLACLTAKLSLPDCLYTCFIKQSLPACSPASKTLLSCPSAR
jgi:hypothetical protein